MLIFQSKGTAQVDPWQLHVLIQERPRHTLPLVYWEEKEDKTNLPQAFFQVQVLQDLCPLSEDPLPATPLLGLDRLCAICDACLANQDQMLNLDLDLLQFSWIYLYEPYDEFSDVALLSLPLPEKTFIPSKRVAKNKEEGLLDNKEEAPNEEGVLDKKEGLSDLKSANGPARDSLFSDRQRSLIDEICDRYFLGDHLRLVLQNYFQEKNFSKLRSEVELAKTHLPHPDQLDRRERMEAELQAQKLASPEKKKKWILERQKVQEAMENLDGHPGGAWAQPEKQGGNLWQKVKFLFGDKGSPEDQALASYVAETGPDYDFKGMDNDYDPMAPGEEQGLSGIWGSWGQRQARRQLQRQILQNQAKEKTLPLPDQIESNSFAVISEGLPGSGREQEGLRAFILTSEFIIGRDAALCDFVLPTKAVGRRHARISKFGEDYFIQDLGSVNGTLLDGKRLNRHELYLLPDRCRLRFADMAFHFSRDHF